MAAIRVDKKEKTRQILEAAMHVFTVKGYNATKIDDIAEKAGIAKGSVYRYFDSKEDLFFDVFGKYNEQLVENVRKQTEKQQESATKQLHDLLMSVLSHYKALEPLVPLTFEFWSASASASPILRKRIDRMFHNMYRQFRKLFVRVIQRGVKSGEFPGNIRPEDQATVLVGLLDGLLLQVWFDSEIDPIRCGKSFMKVFLRGLSAG